MVFHQFLFHLFIDPGCAYDLSLASAVRSEEPDTDPALDLPGLRLESKLDFRPDLR